MKARNNDHRFWDTCVVDSCAYYLCSLGNEQATSSMWRTYSISHVWSQPCNIHYNVPSHHSLTGRRAGHKLFQSRFVQAEGCSQHCVLLWADSAPSHRSCIKLLTSHVRDGDKRWPGQAEQAADGVWDLAGLVNFDVINTSLTAFLLYVLRITDRSAHGTHMLACGWHWDGSHAVYTGRGIALFLFFPL